MSETAPQDSYEYLTDLAQQAVNTYLLQEEIQYDAAQLPIDLRVSAQASFGDYSMPVMSWSGKLKRPPLKIAEALATIFRDMSIPIVQEISATKPGYLNFRLNRPAVGKNIIERVLEAGPDFGQDTLALAPRSLLNILISIAIKRHTLVTCATPALVIPLYVCCVHRAIRSRRITTSTTLACRSLMSWLALPCCSKGCSRLPGGNEQLARASRSTTSVRASIPTSASSMMIKSPSWASRLLRLAQRSPARD